MTDSLQSALSGGSLTALPLMLVGGLVAGLNPCCVALYPAAAATCCGVRGREAKHAFSTALAFTIGLASATSALGVMAALAGRLIATDIWFRYAVALVPLLMGVHLLGLLRLPFPNTASGATRRRIGSAFGAGLLLSLVVGPCSTPIFASALSFAAYKQNTVYGAVLLFVYGLGAGIPVLLAGATIGRVAQRLESARVGGWVNRAVGASLLAVSLYLVWTA